MKTKRLLRLYFSFKGRTRRRSFLFGVLTPFIIISLIIACVFAYFVANPDAPYHFPEPMIGTIAIALVGIASIWIHAAICVKRLHDMNLTGWWYLLYYLAVALSVYLTQKAGLVFLLSIIVLSLRRGTQGPNRFGPDPLETPEA